MFEETNKFFGVLIMVFTVFQMLIIQLATVMHV